jgi:hypothetical protein
MKVHKEVLQARSKNIKTTILKNTMEENRNPSLGLVLDPEVETVTALQIKK